MKTELNTAQEIMSIHEKMLNRSFHMFKEILGIKGNELTENVDSKKK